MNKTGSVLLALFLPSLTLADGGSVFIRLKRATAAGGGGGPEYTDTFTEAANAALQDHTEGGFGWTDRDTSTTGMTISGTNDNLYVSLGSDEFGFYSGYTPSDADYCVEADFTIASSAQTTNGLALRMATGAATQYFVRFAGGAGAWELYKSVAGTETGIGTNYVGDVPTTTKTVRLCASGTSLTVYVAGVSRITATDSDISAAGRPGFYNYFGDNGSDRTADNFKVYETVAAP